jgi:hypothetical protein
MYSLYGHLSNGNGRGALGNGRRSTLGEAASGPAASAVVSGFNTYTNALMTSMPSYNSMSFTDQKTARNHIDWMARRLADAVAQYPNTSYTGRSDELYSELSTNQFFLSHFQPLEMQALYLSIATAKDALNGVGGNPYAAQTYAQWLIATGHTQGSGSGDTTSAPPTPVLPAFPLPLPPAVLPPAPSALPGVVQSTFCLGTTRYRQFDVAPAASIAAQLLSMSWAASAPALRSYPNDPNTSFATFNVTFKKGTATAPYQAPPYTIQPGYYALGDIALVNTPGTLDPAADPWFGGAHVVVTNDLVVVASLCGPGNTYAIIFPPLPVPTSCTGVISPGNVPALGVTSQDTDIQSCPTDQKLLSGKCVCLDPSKTVNAQGVCVAGAGGAGAGKASSGGGDSSGVLIIGAVVVAVVAAVAMSGGSK